MRRLIPIAALGNRIAHARKRKGVLQPELASIVGTTPRQLQKFECGEEPVPPIMRFAIAQALGVAPSELDAPNLVEAPAPMTLFAAE